MCEKNDTAIYIIFNHTLTASQAEDARTILGVSRFISLPDNLQKMWSAISPDLPCLEGYLAPLRDWLKKQAKVRDYALIQGDFGATYLMVRHCAEQGLIPVYSTTRRVAEEVVGSDGTVHLVHQFRHVQFRIYGV